MQFIQYAIDLGTTNSLIAKGENGEVQVFKNPKGFREALPSVVAFRKNGILVGDKARELKDRDPNNVFSSFKRKMGTDSSYWVEQNTETVSPIQLSAFVLNELKTFLRGDEPSSIVITIPASFDTIQSNATKEAGKAAGFEEIVLLQEPIAACLAVFNHQDAKKYGKWLVYDLGGGTFDVAIVDISEESLKVIDHEGNNFLGGLDFDISIVREILIPQLQAFGGFDQIANQLLENSDERSVLPVFNYLLFHAEELKMELSSYPEAYAELTIKNDDGEPESVEVKMTRDELNRLLEPALNQTTELVHALLRKNSLQNSDFNEIVFVGGSTYIPYVKEKIEREIGIPVNQQADPTSAIAVGAAYYAANKEANVRAAEKTVAAPEKKGYRLAPVYESHTREKQEMVLMKSDFEEHLFIRIYRNDLGFDSGKLELTPVFRLSLPLTEKTLNIFTAEIYDQGGALIEKDAARIHISQGLFVIDGQPLPHDICIEVDDLEEKETRLEVIFSKNDILPLKKTIYRTISRNMLTTNSDDELVINILEGDRIALPSTNLVIGSICIRPSEIGKNIIKDSEIGITLSISESRDLEVTAFLSFIDFEVKNVFQPTAKSVNLPHLRESLKFLIFKCGKHREEALQEEDFTAAARYHEIETSAKQALEKLGESGQVPQDTLFHVDEWKRKISVEFDSMTRDQRFIDALFDLNAELAELESYIGKPDFPQRLLEKYQKLRAEADRAIQTNSTGAMKDTRKRLESIAREYRSGNVEQLRAIYLSYRLALQDDAYKDPRQAEKIIAQSDEVLYREQALASEFHAVIHRLYNLLKPEWRGRKSSNEGFDMTGTGIQ